MSRKSPKSERKSLSYHDLASPISSRRGRKLSSRGQADGVSGFSLYNSEVSTPPSFTLEDFSDPKTSSSSWWTLPGRSELVESNSSTTQRMQEMKTDRENTHVKVKDEVARPEIESNSSPVNEQEWVTVYGFSSVHINIVLREFEKCGFILKHIPGPRNTNWMHILYQNRSDAQKALNKNGMQIDGVQINGVLLVGVKRVGPAQQQTLNERLNNPTQAQRMQEMKTNRENTHVKVKDLGTVWWVLFNSYSFASFVYVGINVVSGWVLEKYKIDDSLLWAICTQIILFHVVFVFLLHRRYRGVAYRLVGCRGRAMIELIVLVCAIVLRINFPYDGNDFRKIGLLILVTFQVHSWAQSLHLSWDICLEDAFLHALMEIGTYMTGQSTCIFLVFLFSGLIWIRYKYYWVSDRPEAIKKHLE